MEYYYSPLYLPSGYVVEEMLEKNQADETTSDDEEEEEEEEEDDQEEDEGEEREEDEDEEEMEKLRGEIEAMGLYRQQVLQEEIWREIRESEVPGFTYGYEIEEGEGEGEETEEDEQEDEGNLWDQYHSTSSSLTPISSLSEISPILYRVYDDCSVSKYQLSGFIAGHQRKPRTPYEFSLMLERHVDWKCRLKTPFISVTDSQDTVNWQITIRSKRPNIRVAIIDTAILLNSGVDIWEMHNAMDHFDVDPPGHCKHSTFNNEFICALQVPSVAIVTCCDPRDFEDITKQYLQPRTITPDWW